MPYSYALDTCPKILLKPWSFEAKTQHSDIL